MVAVAFTRTSGWAAVLFPAGVRLSTWLPIIAFVGLAVIWREWRPAGAMFAWLAGFEAAYQASTLATGNGLPAAGWTAPALILFGVIVAGETWRRGVRPSVTFMVATAAVWVAWLAIGYPANEPTLVGLNVPAEVLNEAAKTLWAVAYLVPLLRNDLDSVFVGVDRRAGPVGAGRVLVEKPAVEEVRG